MAGPGGGGRSGGGGRGGFSGGGGSFGGGGRGPGGFHGAPHHRPHHHMPHHRPPMGGFWGYGPRYYGGGGCLGSLIGMALAPVIFGIVAVILIATLVLSSFSEIAQGGTVRYNEQTFQDYANQQYDKVYGGTAYEDNILLVVLTEEDAYNFYYIAWVGDHVDYEVSALFGDNQTVLGRAMNNSISQTNYHYSLDTDLANVVKTMAQKIKGLGLEENLICEEENASAPSQLYNYTQLPLTEETVNHALAKFTEMTDIPCSIVVADMEEVFGRGISGLSLVIAVALVAVVILWVASISKKRRAQQES